MKAVALFLVAFLATAMATIHYQEDFSTDPLAPGNWVQSTWKKAEGSAGTFEWTGGKYPSSPSDKGLKTTEDYRFYTISEEFDDFSNKDKTLVLQYSVKFETPVECGGAYIKLLPSGLDQEAFNGDSVYNIMFGPDVCGSSTRKVHVILTHEGKNHLIKKNIPAESDEFTHLYTLILRPDNTYEVRIDNKEVAKGSIEEDWDILPAKEILDPEQSKPADWVDEKEIADPEDKKPEGYEDIPKEIADPDATKPDDWDDELDGEWEAPLIANPDFKGEWSAKKIPNPAYKGEWVHPKIANPAYAPNPNLYSFDSISFVGIEIWQVKAGTIFDHILVTDSVEEAEAAAKKVEESREAEKKVREAQKEEERKKEEEERKARDAEAEANKANEPEDDDAVEDQAEADKAKDEL